MTICAAACAGCSIPVVRGRCWHPAPSCCRHVPAGAGSAQTGQPQRLPRVPALQILWCFHCAFPVDIFSQLSAVPSHRYKLLISACGKLTGTEWYTTHTGTGHDVYAKRTRPANSLISCVCSAPQVYQQVQTRV